MRNMKLIKKLLAIGLTFIMMFGVGGEGAKAVTVTAAASIKTDKKWKCNLSVSYIGPGYAYVGNAKEINEVYFKSEYMKITAFYETDKNITQTTTDTYNYYIGNSFQLTSTSATGYAFADFEITDNVYGNISRRLRNY